ncbi:MAG: AzlD domain-containing protein [Erysipelotrichaceae bacterium]|nr:AzlD domain-containing protein [Erysipelotrichaceae bacterium]
MIISMILVSALITFGLRALPFLIFKDGKKMPDKLMYLGKILPSAIMAVLIVYCLKGVITSFNYSELLAAIVVFITYKWKHNTMLSILLGTLCNMLLIHLF